MQEPAATFPGFSGYACLLLSQVVFLSTKDGRMVWRLAGHGLDLVDDQTRQLAVEAATPVTFIGTLGACAGISAPGSRIV